MKKTIYFFLVFFLSVNISLTNASEKPIIIYQAENAIVTDKKALLGYRELFVPVEILEEYLKNKVFVDKENGKIYIDISPSHFRLETEKLDKFLTSGARLNFPIKKINGQSYVNIYGLDTILNLTVYNRTNRKGGKLEIVLGGKEKLPPAKLNAARANPSFRGGINLVWDHVKGAPDNKNHNIEKISGLDVLSPTWLAVVNESGEVANNCDIKYVEEAHASGYKVWALITNSFDPLLTKKALASKPARDNIIKQVVLYSSIYNLDGINIDFENVYDSDKDNLTNFVSELTAALKEQNITVSIDVTVPSATSNWSPCYDRAKLARIVDYVMVMTYDEHWRSSPVSGSVASFGWVEKGVKATLAHVPKEKLLLGIPFYTREWEESVQTGQVTVKAKTLSMADVEKIIADYRPEVKWLHDSGQYYMEYTKPDDGSGGKNLYRVWLEDEKSIALKASLVHKYNLAGAASWRKGFEKPEIWMVLEKALKS